MPCKFTSWCRLFSCQLGATPAWRDPGWSISQASPLPGLRGSTPSCPPTLSKLASLHRPEHRMPFSAHQCHNYDSTASQPDTPRTDLTRGPSSLLTASAQGSHQEFLREKTPTSLKHTYLHFARALFSLQETLRVRCRLLCLPRTCNRGAQCTPSTSTTDSSTFIFRRFRGLYELPGGLIPLRTLPAPTMSSTTVTIPPQIGRRT